jgi:hypothetical protein
VSTCRLATHSQEKNTVIFEKKLLSSLWNTPQPFV